MLTLTSPMFVGLDLSERMLAKARQKVASLNLRNVDLLCADAMFCNFAPQSFDHILLSHVISVVSDPVQLIRLAYYLGKPGCRIVIINHFRSANRMIGLIETLICPLCMHLGWRSDLSLQELIRSTGLQIDYRYKIESVDLWETVFARVPDSDNQPILQRSA
jgi:phosphatidylethanolamine/phosphatidyl-N-methylethanolamine N-methyltransferase